MAFDTDALTLTVTGGADAGVLNGIAGTDGSAVFCFNSLNIAGGATVTVTGGNPISLLSKANVVIGSAISLDGGVGGSIVGTGDGTGGLGVAGGADGGAGLEVGQGSGPGVFDTFNSPSGASYGGRGGVGNSNQADTATYGRSNLDRIEGGSGGGGGGRNGAFPNGGGGAGGGAIEIAAVGDVTINANISTNGGNGGGADAAGGASIGASGSGGSGGMVYVNCVNFANTATISADGGDGGLAQGGTSNDRSGGGGGGGRIQAVYSGTLTQGTVQALGGAAGGGTQTGTAGSAGSVVFLDSGNVAAPGTLNAEFSTADFTTIAANLTVQAADTVTINTDIASLSGATAGDGSGRLALSDQGTLCAVFEYGTIDLQTGGTINVTGTNPLVLLATGNATIATVINLDGETPVRVDNNTGGAPDVDEPQGGNGGPAGGWEGGYGQDLGSGPGASLAIDGFDGGNGASHGGAGGQGGDNSNAVGSIYGSLPIDDLRGGSGGDGGNRTDPIGANNNKGGGGGGGALEIKADGDLIVQANISANGGGGADEGNTNDSSSGGGGGSGGTILLVGDNVTIDPGVTVEANGGPGSVMAQTQFDRGGGGGGGGVVEIRFTTSLAQNGTVQSLGGTGGTGNSANGANGSDGVFAVPVELSTFTIE